MGQEGSLSIYRIKDGKLRWRYLFGSQSHSKTYPYRRRATPSHTSPIVGAKRVWLGAYDRTGRFTIYALWQRQKTLQKKLAVLKGFLDKFKQKNNKQLYHKLLSRAIDRHDSAFREQFLHLLKQKQLSAKQRLRWAFAYLSTGDDLQADLKRLQTGLKDIPKTQLDYSTRGLDQSKKKSIYSNCS